MQVDDSKIPSVLKKIVVAIVCVAFGIVVAGNAITGLISGDSASESHFVQNNSATILSQGYEAHEWSASAAPDGYAVLGSAVIDHDVNAGEFYYSGLDNHGRTGYAVTSLTRAIYDKELSEEREKFGADADKISGWGHNVKAEIVWPNGTVFKDYGLNRSHLIADSLGGEGKQKNLVTGTRFQNVGDDNKGGMAYAEDKARKWLSTAGADETLYYCATPVYVGDELCPRAVYVDMASSDGEIDEHIEVFNVTGDTKNNVSLDWATGYLQKDGKNIEKK